MSTKSTIAHGVAFHLYYEHTDGEVHLKIDRDADFEARSGEVRIKLPRVVLETIADTRKAWEAAYADEGDND